MLSEDQLRALMQDLESDCVERTTSTKNKDKFGEAICAFANDLPNHRRPGYLLIGVRDDGRASGLVATDDLLKIFGAIRDEGNILPLPTLSVQKISLADGSGDVVVVEVLPSDMPPVRYKHRVCVRIGPRREVASEQDERILFERRTVLARSFDAQPHPGATLRDLSPELFELHYVPRAISAETLAENHRPLEHKLASLRFFDLDRGCPTNAGLLLFGIDPRRFLESAYVHLLRWDGVEKEIAAHEHRVAGDLNAVLQRVHDFFEVYNVQRTISEDELRTRSLRDYPAIALRELVNNAVMHRQYDAGGPVRIDWFDDRIEIQSPGGLYGEVTPENFPRRYAYRNPVIAEALKVLGHVEKFGSGVEKAQRALSRAGHRPAEFAFDRHFVQVTVWRRA